jgi:hypothetical protein
MRPHGNEDHNAGETPIRVAARGAAAGLAAALVLSALSRLLPGLWDEHGDQRSGDRPNLPENANDPEVGRRWQERSQPSAASTHIVGVQPSREGKEGERRGEPAAVTPAGALAQPPGPGPEGLAEQFAFKVASGVFASDISSSVRPVGLATHLAYGSLWGVLFGIVQASYRLRPGLFGPLFGLAVYGVGPAFLVPAMKIMRPPQEEPPERTSLLILGHVVYGAVLAEVFALQRKDE